VPPTPSIPPERWSCWAKRGAKCPSGYVYCVTLSAGQPAQLYFCYSTVSYCGPSQYPYTWTSGFIVRKGDKLTSDFTASFSPNPGNPTYDTVGEAVSVKSTHGKYKYAQVVCPGGSGFPCQATFLVGIAVR
jgi:hypothetical protein